MHDGCKCKFCDFCNLCYLCDECSCNDSYPEFEDVDDDG